MTFKLGKSAAEMTIGVETINTRTTRADTMYLMYV